MKVRFTRLRQGVALPAYQTPGSAGFDLAAAETTTIPPQGHAIVPTGLVMATPPGHVTLIAARSSLFKKKGLLLANGVGVLDSDYCGPEDELKLSLYNPGDAPVTVEAGERLAQGLIVPVIRAEFEEGPADGASRGGFGSTG